MGFTLYRVDADLTEPTATVIGVGSICEDLPTAQAERDRLNANPRYCNVRIERRDYGAVR
jgi:hypothetical protein